jgi:hypothetical protein
VFFLEFCISALGGSAYMDSTNSPRAHFDLIVTKMNILLKMPFLSHLAYTFE